MTQTTAPTVPKPAVIALLLLVAVGVYVLLAWPAMSGPFVFDDYPNLAALGKVGSIHGWRDVGLYLSESRNFPGRPLAMLSFLPQQASWPSDAMPFKCVNLFLHLANAVLLALLFVRCARERLPAATATAVAGATAVAWLVMPMQLSTVLLVVQRMTLLSTTFMLVGLLAYVHSLRAVELGIVRRGAWMAFGLGACAVLAVLCKETGALLPIYAWALDATLLRARRDALPPPLGRLRSVLVYTAAAGLAAYFAMQLPTLFDTLGYRGFSLAERLLTQPRVLLDYLGGAALPSYAKYGVFHDDFTVSRGLLSPWTTLPALLAVVGALVAAFGWRRRAPLFAFAVLWFLGGHVLEAGPVPLELVFEHRNYLPIAGPLFAVALALAGRPRDGLRSAGIAAAALWLAASLFATALYAQVWSSADKLSYFWATAHPSSMRAQNFYAQTLFSHGMYDWSAAVLRDAQARLPDDASIGLTRIYVDCARGSATPEAVAAMRATLATTAWSRSTFENLGDLRALASEKRCPKALDADAWLGLSNALMANPAYRRDKVALGTMHYQRHELAVGRGQLDRAIAELDAVATTDPDPEIVRLQARYLLDAGLADQGIERLRRYDPSRRPRLRRWLVDDVAINREAIEAIRARASARP